MKDDLMLIGEIADFFGISRKAIRLYEKKGIIKPVKVDAANGYRYYSAEQVQQLLEKKRRAWQETADSARYKEECLGGIIQNVQTSSAAQKITNMTEEERAWLLVKMVCIEDVRAQKTLSEALWL